MAERISIPEKGLRQLYWKDGLTTFEIADLLGCSAGTVVNQMRKYRIQRRTSGPKRLKINEAVLRNLYEDRGLSAEKIARIFHCEQTAIFVALKRYNIAIRHPKERVVISKNKLEQLYTVDQLSTYKIAKKYYCDAKTVYSYLKFYKIATRPRKVVLINKNKLLTLYVKKRYSLSKIAAMYGCHPVAILKKMERFGIDRRTISETSTKHIKKDFSGDNEEKAYLIGFRLGDLNVRKEGNLIRVGCGTTKSAQLNLIQGLFKNYGPGWITEKDRQGRFHIDFSLNRSFNFLIPKHKNILYWVMRSQKLFFQFLAGYMDAEGNIGIYSGRAKLRIRSYDYGILQDIHRKLLGLGMRSIFTLEDMPGTDKRGVKHNGTYLGVTVNKREDLYKLLGILKGVLRHQKRRDDLEAALQNVYSRLH